MMQIGRINSPKLRPRLPSSQKPKLKSMSTWFEREVSIKTKYGHRRIMLINITATNSIIRTYFNIFLSYSFSWTSNNSSQHRSMKHKPYWKPTNYVLSQLCNYNSSYFQEGSHVRAFWQVHILNYHLVFYDC